MIQHTKLRYQTGFGNYFTSEAVPGTLPDGQNSPQICKHGLYAEQLSGSPFTAPRKENVRTWLYRMHPSVGHGSFEPLDEPDLRPADDSNSVVTPNQLRWLPEDIRCPNLDFAQSLLTTCGCGSPLQKSGYAIHTYAATRSMGGDQCLCNADGDFLIVVQQGSLDIMTELGLMHVEPCEICVIPRGIRFSVGLAETGLARGYILEIYEGHFVLPELGPIGSNGLANPRDFEVPVAAFRAEPGGSNSVPGPYTPPFTVLHKLGGRIFAAAQDFSPFDVVAWHGNYVPYKYDLRKFCPMNTVRVDHADPSIFTVLTCPSSIPGTAVADFVVFPPRWSVAEDTFRPPYFHRNVMNEYMGLICGAYEAKAAFKPGGASLHVCMSPHGPDLPSFTAATALDTGKPQRLPTGTMAFMFEVSHTPRVMRRALDAPNRDRHYCKATWAGFPTALLQLGQAGSKRKAVDSNGGLPPAQVHKAEALAETQLPSG